MGREWLGGNGRLVGFRVVQFGGKEVQDSHGDGETERRKREGRAFGCGREGGGHARGMG